jgi:hypothetical protein
MMSDVTPVVSLGTNNQVQDFEEHGDMQEEVFQFPWIFILLVIRYILQTGLLSGYSSFLIFLH